MQRKKLLMSGPPAKTEKYHEYDSIIAEHELIETHWSELEDGAKFERTRAALLSVHSEGVSHAL